MEIDDVLKKSFASPSFDYKEVHWAAASAMIDSHYKVKLRNRIIAISLALLVLLATGFLAYQLVLKNPPGNSKQDQIILGPIAGADIENIDNQVSDHQSESSRSVLSEKIGSENKGILKSDEILNQLGAQANNNKLLSDHDISDQGFGKEFVKDQNNNYARGNREKSNINNGSINDTNETSSVLLNGVEDGLVIVNQEDHMSLTDRLFEGDNPDLSLMVDFIKDREDLTSLNTLPLPFNAFYSEQDPYSVTQLFEFYDLERQQFSRESWNQLKYFVGTEIMTFPGMRQDANRFVGAGISGGINWFFHPNFFIDASLGLSIRSGNFDPSIASTQYSQFFGPRFDSYIFRPKELLNASMPVSLGYEFGRNQLLLGYRINYLIGVHGNMEYANHMNDPGEIGNEYTYEPIKSGWLSKEGFRNYMGGFIFSYRYEFSPRFYGGIRLHYLPNDWIARDFGQSYDINSMRYVSPDAQINGLREKNWILGFNITYIL